MTIGIIIITYLFLFYDVENGVEKLKNKYYQSYHFYTFFLYVTKVLACYKLRIFVNFIIFSPNKSAKSQKTKGAKRNFILQTKFFSML